jgi:hypothetical protein
MSNPSKVNVDVARTTAKARPRAAARRGRGLAVLAAGLGVALSAGTTLGQLSVKPKEPLAPPTISGKSDDSQVWAVAGSLLFLMLCIVATIIPSKRGHQD